jgi:hypothetical protein
VTDRRQQPAASSWLSRLKPGEREVRELALRETDPAQARRFAPIAKGPVFALAALAAVALAALPACVLRLLRRPEPPAGAPR